MPELRWPVSRSGYCWELDHGGGGLVQRLVTYDTGEGVRVYEPMRAEPDLFVEFAGMAGDDDAYLQFAARYGQLTRSVTVVPRPKVDSDAWRDDVNALVRRPKLPPASGGRDPAALAGLDDALRFPNEGGDGSLCSFPTLLDTRIEVPHRAEDSELWANHTTEMSGMIRRWRAKPSGRELDLLRRGIEVVLGGRAVFAFDSKTGQPSLAPSDLLSALWLQFAFAVGGARRYVSCKRCAKLFAVSVPNSETERRVRADKQYCASECQMAAAYALRKPKRTKDAAARVKGTRSSTARKKRSRGPV